MTFYSELFTISDSATQHSCLRSGVTVERRGLWLDTGSKMAEVTDEGKRCLCMKYQFIAFCTVLFTVVCDVMICDTVWSLHTESLLISVDLVLQYYRSI